VLSSSEWLALPPTVDCPRRQVGISVLPVVVRRPDYTRFHAKKYRKIPANKLFHFCRRHIAPILPKKYMYIYIYIYDDDDDDLNLVYRVLAISSH
jgi:hypothetical protein